MPVKDLTISTPPEKTLETQAAKRPQRVGFVSLGCPKNLVDSEVMMGLLARAGAELTTRAEDAEVIVVNTCSFIESAQQESVNTILEMASHKTGGRAKKLVVAGCLVERFRDDIRKNIPSLDQFDHMIVFVPASKGGSFFDCTSKDAPLSSGIPIGLAEQDALVFERIEKFLGNGVVGAFAVPLRDELAGFWVDGAGIAAADMDAERDAGESFDERIVGVDGTLKISFGVLTTGAHSVQGNLIDVRCITRRVDLNVLATRLY